MPPARTPARLANESVSASGENFTLPASAVDVALFVEPAWTRSVPPEVEIVVGVPSAEAT